MTVCCYTRIGWWRPVRTCVSMNTMTMRVTQRKRRGVKPRDIQDRFWEKVDQTGDCWVWTSAIVHGGYGTFSLGHARTGRAHVLSWEWANAKPVPTGHWVLHRCDNPPCVRPEHLFTGFPRDNTADMIAKGRNRRPSTLNAARGERAGNAILTDRAVVVMRAERQLGHFYKDIAARHGVTVPTAWSAILGKTWGHVKEGLPT